MYKRESAVKRLKIRNDEWDLVFGWAGNYTSLAEQFGKKHYGNSWVLNRKLLVMKSSLRGKHMFDTVLPLDALEKYLAQSREMKEFMQLMAQSSANYMANVIAEAFGEATAKEA